MLQDIKHIYKENLDHTYILIIELTKLKETDFNLDTIKDIIFLDIVKNTFDQEKIYDLLNHPSIYELIQKILLKDMRFYKTDNHLILAVKINEIPETANFS